MVREVIKDADGRMGKAETALAHEFGTIRTGRASASILENVKVEYYGTQTPLLQLANVTSPEPQLLVVSPYDRSAIGSIEKAVRSSDLGLNPSNDGQVVRIPFPPLTEERRKELVKLAKHYAEEARVAVRNIRREANESVKRAERDHEISQDEMHRAEAEIQKVTDRHIADIDEMLVRKEQEIMEV